MKNTECNKNNIRELYVNLKVETMIHYTPPNDADRYHKNY